MSSRFEFRLLGPLEVRHDGSALHVPAGKLRIILATLLLFPRKVVTPERLSEYVWSDGHFVDRAPSLHPYISRLRKTFSRYPGGAKLIVTNPGGYSISVEDETIDRGQLDQLASVAQRHEAEGNITVAADCLADALALFRGQPLADIRSSLLHRDAAAVLHEEQLKLLGKRIELDLRLGRHEALIGELTALVEQYPLQENFWRYLMLALLRSGRQADALATYSKVRAHLADELGLDPGTELQQTHQLALTGTGTPSGVELVADGAYASPAEPAGETGESPAAYHGHVLAQPWLSTCTLAPDIVDFVGRLETRERITTSLSQPPSGYAGPRVVVLYGMAGLGKTAFATRLAHEMSVHFPDGQYLLELGGTGTPRTEPRELLGELLYATGVNWTDIPESAQARATACRGRLHNRQVLLMLDNAHDAAQVNALLPSTGTCAAIVTSRLPLPGVGGDVVHHRMQVLAPAEGDELLTRIIRPERGGGDHTALRDIVTHCDGHPLALRIVGSKLINSSGNQVRAMLTKLRDVRNRLDQLADADRQVRSGFAVCYANLPGELQLPFRRMYLLGGNSFAAWAVGTLADTDNGDDVIEGFSEHGIITWVGVDDTGAPRYRMHSLLTEYSKELAEHSGRADEAGALRALLDAYLTASASAFGYMAVSMQDALISAAKESENACVDRLGHESVTQGSGWFRTERTNIRALVEHAIRVGWYVDAHGLLELLAPVESEDGNWLRTAQLYAKIRDTAREHEDAEAATCAELGRLYQLLSAGDTDLRAGFSDCVTALDATGNRHDLARALVGLAFCQVRQDQPETARAPAERAACLVDEHSTVALRLITCRTLALAASAVGDYERALELLDEALVLNAHHYRNEASRTKNEANLLNFRAYAALEHTDIGQARSDSLRSLGLLKMLGERHGVAYTMTLLARIELTAGNLADAEARARRSVPIFRALADERGITAVSELLTRVQKEQVNTAAVPSRPVDLRGRIGELIAGGKQHPQRPR